MSKQAASPARWPLDIISVGSASVGVQLWRHRGQLNVTILAKAMFSIVPSGTATVAPPEELVRQPVYATGNPASPLLFEHDLAPYLPSAEIVFTGHAHSPNNVPVPRMQVRLALLREGTALVDKRLEVVGDRVAQSNLPVPEPKPFLRMPIVYQRAWGGPGESSNPFGVGLGMGNSRVQLPNVVPLDGSRSAVCLGPVPSFYPARNQLLRGATPPELSSIPLLPDDFDGRYFYQAPADQLFDALRGGERLVLEGLAPHRPMIETRLPALRGLASLYLPNGAQRWILLVPTTLVVKGDTNSFAVVCRGHFQVADENALPALRVTAGVEVDGAPMAWPDPNTILARPVMTTPAPETVKHLEEIDWNSTLTLDDVEVEEPASLSSADIGLARQTPPGTVDDMAVTRELQVPVLVEASEVQPIAYSRLDVTLAESATPSSLRAPFPITRPGARISAGREDIPGAPWAARPLASEAIPSPNTSVDTTLEIRLKDVVRLEEIAAPAPATPVMPALPAAPEVTALPIPPRAPIWAEPPPAPAVPVVPPPPPPAPRISPAKSDLAEKMYGRFRKR